MTGKAERMDPVSISTQTFGWGAAIKGLRRKIGAEGVEVKR